MRHADRRAIMLHIVLATGALAMLFPFLWMVAMSFMALHEVEQYPPVWIPETLRWSNYAEALMDWQIGRALLNSMVVTGTGIVGQILISSSAAYAFARLRFPGRDHMFLVYLATLMIPFHVTLIPLYRLVWSAGLTNSYAALILPGLFSPFSVFLLRQFFLQIPRELDEAARLDGAGRWRIYWEIVMPLSRPALAGVGIFSFLNIWNELLWPLVAVSDQGLFTLPLAVASMGGQFVSTINVQMAGASIASLPVVLAFLLLQRHFIASITTSGLKQ